MGKKVKNIREFYFAIHHAEQMIASLLDAFQASGFPRKLIFDQFERDGIPIITNTNLVFAVKDALAILRHLRSARHDISTKAIPNCIAKKTLEDFLTKTRANVSYVHVIPSENYERQVDQLLKSGSDRWPIAHNLLLKTRRFGKSHIRYGKNNLPIINIMEHGVTKSGIHWAHAYIARPRITYLSNLSQQHIEKHKRTKPLPSDYFTIKKGFVAYHPDLPSSSSLFDESKENAIHRLESKIINRVKKKLRT